MKYEWELRLPDRAAAAALAARCGVDPVVAQCLLNRGIATPEEAQRFFSPTLDRLEAPRGLPDLPKAVARIRKALAGGERICVFGDADVDGVTAATIVSEAVEALAPKGAPPVVVRLSNRLENGYGFPQSLVQELVKLGVSLAILVDCGTNQPDEIQALAAQRIDAIVLDHHILSARVAQPLALVNPCREGGTSVFCSAGLAVKLVQALWPGQPERVAPYLDLAALGTLADCAPLTGENRILVMEGAKRLLQTQRIGLAQLCERMGLTTATPDQILKRLVPALNASGRLGNPRPVWELFVAKRRGTAATALNDLGQAHLEIKALGRRIVAEAHEQASRINFKDQRVVVVGRRGWHAGIMGPVASQLSERFGRPAIAIALDERVGVGSGRCQSAFNLYEALQACEGVLLRYGGHPQACGLTIETQRLEPFRERINRHAGTVMEQLKAERTLRLDAVMTLAELQEPLVAALERFRPFGRGNPRPQLLVQDVAVELGGNDQVRISDGRHTVRVRGRAEGLVRGARYDVVVSPVLGADGVAVSVTDAKQSAGAVLPEA